MHQPNGSGLYYIGLMSGTSLDGIDACLAQIEDKQLTLSETYYAAYPDPLRENIQRVCKNPNNDSHDLDKLAIQLADQYADIVRKLLNKAKLKPEQIKAIGNHGQTIRHCPDCDPPYTIQLGDGDRLTSLTNIKTIDNFRQQDIAAGGQGAPLAPAFHQFLFSQSGETVVGLNLGGIANISILHADGRVTGHDTGPANTLMNQWIQRHKQVSYDNNGEWARSGLLNEKLLQELLTEPWLNLPPPKSTGPELFNLEWLNTKLNGLEVAPENVQRTLCEYSAITIADQVKQHASKTCRLVVCGGGAHNALLMERIAASMPGIEIKISSDYGIAPDWIESAMMAWLAHRCLQGLPGNIPEVTGAKEAKVLGVVHPVLNK